MLKLIALLTTFTISQANPPPANDHSGQPDMNGIAYQDFRQIVKTWELVTVRFRKDNNEMRFTYANPVAMQNLRQGVRDYPEGAVFAKVSRISESDPAFESSLVPSGSTRFQFMVRDKKKYQATDGWGYALFDSTGHTFPGEPKAAAKACAACHQLVPQRGLVFSQLMSLGSTDPTVRPEGSAGMEGVNLTYKKVKVTSLPASIRHWIPDSEDSVMSLQGILKSAAFSGTLDEIVPSLSLQVSHEHKPSLLLTDDGQSFSLVLYDRLSRACPSDQSRAMLSVQGLTSGQVTTKKFCYDVKAPSPKRR